MDENIKTISLDEYNNLKEEPETKFGKGTTYKDATSIIPGKAIIYKDIEYYCPEA